MPHDKPAKHILSHHPAQTITGNDQTSSIMTQTERSSTFAKGMHLPCALLNMRLGWVEHHTLTAATAGHGLHFRHPPCCAAGLGLWRGGSRAAPDQANCGSSIRSLFPFLLWSLVRGRGVPQLRQQLADAGRRLLVHVVRVQHLQI